MYCACQGAQETRNNKVFAALHQQFDDVDRLDEEIGCERILVERTHKSCNKEPIDEIVLWIIHILDDG